MMRVYLYFGDTLRPDQDFRDKGTISVALLPPAIRALVAPSGQTEVDLTDIPLRQLTGFQSYNTRDGINLWAHKTNFDGQLSLDSPSPRTAHNLRSTIDDFISMGSSGHRGESSVQLLHGYQKWLDHR
ncbi:hypothetical protein [Acaryochloris marina]|uniref:Uncharacterized protein n=1 Tax=Acaryochloris marina (strain MBIC 11017) TaxID=329726 RepID=B0CFW6_ACAM1|nr:hypothetical protein [Acaryochloris marina]ABW29413.1 hypothetical protein AM1_4436 [Acaryochloris marina MBIC11017]BDM78328.1 hypothetical protein AM10699_11980 [Acaryochloris marina MBIC10699]